MNYEQNIGTYLISIDLGIGEIIGVKEISDSGYFYNVTFPNSNVTNYIAVGSPKFRILADKKQINQAIEIFNEVDAARVFESAKDKIQYYREELKACDICELAQALGELSHEDEIHSGIKKMHEMAMKSFVDEIKVVLDVTKPQANDLLKAA